MHVVEPWSNWPRVKFLFLKLFVTIFDPDIPSSSEHGYLLLYPWFFFILDTETFHYLDSSTSVTTLSTKCFFLIEFGGWWCSLLVLQGQDWISSHTPCCCSLSPLESSLNEYYYHTHKLCLALPCRIFIYLFIYLFKMRFNIWEFLIFQNFNSWEITMPKIRLCVMPLGIGTERFSIFKHFWKKTQ